MRGHRSRQRSDRNRSPGSPKTLVSEMHPPTPPPPLGSWFCSFVSAPMTWTKMPWRGGTALASSWIWIGPSCCQCSPLFKAPQPKLWGGILVNRQCHLARTPGLVYFEQRPENGL
ncbi:hypothetical protein CCHR01_01606 [Colletotrichum chrysophilum]|uniref:Uncharacterized protein n=1 Tax=Colletotrichum chrysophilum TaxID=1836956 RepID=A0AAD9EP42_9PEZI|nr:hypothetical protein CCHR01_01606 [Colletotrichum chrysophilum]